MFHGVHLAHTPPPRPADVDERIATSSDTGWPYLEQLKVAYAAKLPALIRGGPPKTIAWMGVDRNALANRAKAAADAEAVADKAAAESAKSTGITDLLTMPPHQLIATRVERALKEALRADDAADAQVPEWTPGSSGAPRLREWLPPRAVAAWVAGGALPKERGLSVLVLRTRELLAMLARIAACEDNVFTLVLRGPGAGGGLPSHIDLDLITSRLPNLLTLEIYFGPLDRTAAPLVGIAPPLREEAAALENEHTNEGSDGSPTVFSAPMTAALDSFIEGILPVDAPALCRALRCAETLTTLVLSMNMMNDAVGVMLATALSGCTTLRSLDVSHNLMGDKGLCAMAALVARVGGLGPALSSFSVAGNAGGARSAAALAAALTAAPWLTTLDASMNPLGDDGATVLLNAAAGHRGLQRLCLAGVGAGAAAASAAAKMLLAAGTVLLSLNLSANELLNESGVALITDAVVGAREAGVGATRICELDVRPAEEPVLLTKTLKANRISARPDGPLTGIYKAMIGLSTGGRK